MMPDRILTCAGSEEADQDGEMKDEDHAEHEIGHMGVGDLDKHHVRGLRDLRSRDAREPSYERVSRAGPPGLQMADVVGFPAWSDRKLPLRRLRRARVLPGLQLAAPALGRDMKNNTRIDL